jgi:hypothetical protein
MDNEDKFWLCAWGMALAFLLAVIVCITVHAWNKLDKWEKAVSNGADPMVTTCALHGDVNIAICTILAQGRK